MNKQITNNKTNNKQGKGEGKGKTPWAKMEKGKWRSSLG